MMRKVCLMFVTVMVSAVYANAQVPQSINYQGRLMDINGLPLNMNVDIVFSIYDSPDPLAGASLWSEPHAGVPTVNGLFSVILGETNPIDTTILPAGTTANRWLGVVVNGEELLPRKPMVSVAYALKANDADTVDSFHAVDFVYVGGDTMTGDLVMSGATVMGLPATPVAADEATSKAYVDNTISTAITSIDNIYVNETGDVMTGALGMSGNSINDIADPVAGTDAANKQYVDASITGLADVYVDESGDTMSGALSMGNNPINDVADPVAGKDAANKDYVDVAGGQFVKKAGDTMTGNLTMSSATITGLPVVPATSDEATSKAYVDNEITGLSGVYVNETGDTMTGVLGMSGNKIQDLAYPAIGTDASSKQYVDDTVNIAGANYVKKTGDTMTGNLNMSGATVKGLPAVPANLDDAVSKAYVKSLMDSVGDEYVNTVGDSMTGPLTIKKSNAVALKVGSDTQTDWVKFDTGASVKKKLIFTEGNTSSLDGQVDPRANIVIKDQCSSADGMGIQMLCPSGKLSSIGYCTEAGVVAELTYWPPERQLHLGVEGFWGTFASSSGFCSAGKGFYVGTPPDRFSTGMQYDGATGNLQFKVNGAVRAWVANDGVHGVVASGSTLTYEGDALTAIEAIESRGDYDGDWKLLEHASLPEGTLVVATNYYKDSIAELNLPDHAQYEELGTVYSATNYAYGWVTNNGVVTRGTVEEPVETYHEVKVYSTDLEKMNAVAIRACRQLDEQVKAQDERIAAQNLLIQQLTERITALEAKGQ